MAVGEVADALATADGSAAVAVGRDCNLFGHRFRKVERRPDENHPPAAARLPLDGVVTKDRKLTPAGIEGTVLVTGGTGALGRAVLAELLDSGASVVSTWVDKREIERLPGELTERVQLVEADLSSDDGAAAAVKAAIEAGSGGLSGLVNLVGGFAAGGRLHEEPTETLEKMLALNLVITARATRAALPALLEGDGGTIICVGAKHALQPFPGGAAVSISKAGVLALVRALDVEYRTDGVRSNVILPNLIDTPANRASDPDADTSKWVKPEEIARVVRFLCSPDSAPVSGAEIPVYGRA
jgi:NAD(P)-dependent dehydrogenase (short-subunit alcohol dehydrogenase family)